ncbi:MAG: hypothetical protein KBA03_03310 [Anaerolineaceae bacterium]|nr:hypothetical protein [Anaerolineaceae bacterium]
MSEISERGEVDTLLEEHPLVELPLHDEAASAENEYSGLAWWNDSLILLPQYPSGIWGNQESKLYLIEKANILAWLENPELDLEIETIPFLETFTGREIAGFEGYEAIEFIGDSVYLTIEASPNGNMKAYVVKGLVEHADGKLQNIRLDQSLRLELETQNDNKNASYEALTTDGEFLYAIFEQNGVEQNQQPLVFKINQDLVLVDELPIEPVNFRLTDASEIDENGEFWMINYFFTGDTHLKVKSDAISEKYGLGKSHLENEVVERFVKFKLNEKGVNLVEDAPIYLELLPKNVARNWEGLVELDDIGFLIITDKFPNSILSFVNIK